MGSKRAIVSDRPGTTRDIVERSVLIDGIEICFFDTAGARFDSHDPIENEGIQMGLELAKEADLCLLVHPANQELGVILRFTERDWQCAIITCCNSMQIWLIVLTLNQIVLFLIRHGTGIF